MIITLLGAVGVFSLKSASLAEQAIGFNRMGIRAYYASELGARMYASHLSGADETYGRAALKGNDSDCRSTILARKHNEALEVGEEPIPAHCITMDQTELLGELEYDYVGSGDGLVGRQGAGDNLDVGLIVEITDVQQAGIPLPGHDVNSKLKYYRCVMTAEAEVRPILGDEASDEAVLNATAVQRMRGQVVFGPVAL